MLRALIPFAAGCGGDVVEAAGDGSGSESTLGSSSAVGASSSGATHETHGTATGESHGSDSSADGSPTTQPSSGSEGSSSAGDSSTGGATTTAASGSSEGSTGATGTGATSLDPTTSDAGTTSGGTTSDAGTTSGGATSDAGTSSDAGTTSGAGTTSDAGTTSAAGTATDPGTATDAGTTSGAGTSDAGTTTDPSTSTADPSTTGTTDASTLSASTSDPSISGTTDPGTTTDPGSTTDPGGSTTDPGGGTTDGSSSDGGTTGGGGPLPLFIDHFDGPDGAPWNDPWTIVGDNVLSATLQGGRGQLSGITGGTARLILPGFAELDADVFVTIEFTDWSAQGFGVYQRQNGGSLTQTDPPGEGYALFLEGFYLQSLGIWTELAGVETLAYASYDPVPGGVQAGVRYRVRYQVQQQGSESALRAKIWLEGDAEPAAWTFEITDATVELQDQPGSFAVDIYNWAGVDSVYVDDVEIWPL
ncbi:MAG: hypothetical protein U0168_25920 [Nannocystaceae bacterium]